MATRILIVEDEPRIASQIESALEAEGLEGIGCVSVLSEVKHHLGEQSIEFALIDSERAAESAKPVADYLRSVGMPFAVITAATEATNWTEDVLAVEKPFDPENLARAIRRLCNVRGLAGCLRSG